MMFALAAITPFIGNERSTECIKPVFCIFVVFGLRECFHGVGPVFNAIFRLLHGCYHAARFVQCSAHVAHPTKVLFVVHFEDWIKLGSITALEYLECELKSGGPYDALWCHVEFLVPRSAVSDSVLIGTPPVSLLLEAQSREFFQFQVSAHTLVFMASQLDLQLSRNLGDENGVNVDVGGV